MFKKFSLILFSFLFSCLALFWGNHVEAISDSSIIGTYTMNTGNSGSQYTSPTSTPFNLGALPFNTYNQIASSDASAPCIGTPIQQAGNISVNNTFAQQNINDGYTFSWDINHHGDADTGSWNRMNARIIIGEYSSTTGRSLDLQMAYANGKVTLSNGGNLPSGSWTTNNNLNFVKDDWTRYTFVVESTGISFYIDGSLDKVYTYSNSFDFTTYNTLGNFYIYTSSGIYGAVENWTLFNRPLSMAEIIDTAGECFNSSIPFTYCGDGSCNNNETCSGCAADCGQCEGVLHPAGIIGTYIMNTGNSGNQYTNPTSTPFNLGALTFNTYRQTASPDASAPCAGTPIQQAYNSSINNTFTQQNINGGYTFFLDVNHHGDADTGSWNRLGGHIIFGYTNSTLGRSFDLNMNYASGKVTLSSGGNLPSGSWTTNNQLSIIKNSWTRYTFIVESTKISFYIDGALDKVYTYRSPFDFNTYNQLGYFYSNFAGLYGAVENWSLFNRPLSMAEITEADDRCFDSSFSFSYCGDSTCNGAETCSTCAADCGQCDGVVHSVVAGGNWNNASTWVGGMVPTSTDIVEINGTVEVASDISIAGLTVSSNATLQNYSSGSQRLTVNGDVVNNGTIQSSHSYDFYLTVSGDITNNGTWNNSWTDLSSTQSRFIGGTNPISGPVTFLDSFEVSNSPVFNGYVYFNGKTITISSSTQSITLGSSVTFSGSVAGQGSLIISGASGISGTTTANTIIFNSNSSRFSGNYTADNIIIRGSGSKEIDADTVFNGSLIVESAATLQNYSSESRSLTVNGDVTNNGAIKNDDGGCYNFYLTIFGDIANNGTWSNFETRIGWPFVFGAISYEVNITDDEDNWPAVVTTAATSYDISNLVNSSRYWRVRPSGGYWSSIKRINIGLFGGFTFNTISSSQMATRPIELTISAVDINGNPYSYSGSISLSASNNGTTTPSIITMSDGSWTGTTSISMFGDNTTLTATGGGENGTSNAFNLKKKPVVIVPGIISSYLNKNVTGLPEIWPNIDEMIFSPEDSYLDDLKMDQFGEPLIASLMRPTDIFRSIAGNDIFQGLISELTTNNGYTENENLFVYPYDWRRDVSWIASSSPYSLSESLREKIQEVKESTGAEKVDIIAHSMGGIIVKDYIKHSGTDSIDKFIDIATPHLGSPKAAKILLYGDDLDMNRFGFGLSDQKIKEISQNFPSVYELLPSRSYFDASSTVYNAYIADLYDTDNNSITGNLSYDDSIDFLVNLGGNSSMASMNDDIHEDLDSFNPVNYGVKTYNIVGCNQPTMSRIYIINHYASSSYEYGLGYTNGDGTVPVKSAESLNNVIHTYYNINNTASGTHAFLSSLDGDRQLIAAILNESLSQFNFSLYPSIQQDNSNCGPLSGYEISYHSPIALHIYDEQGRHIGPDEKGNIEINIPGAAYDVIGDNKFAFVPKGHNYKITGQATGLGHFNARIQDIQDGKAVSVAYYNEVPIKSLGTNIEIDFANNKPNYEMKIDQKGDRIFRERIKPNSILTAKEAEDRVKPETRAEISGQTIKLISSDDNSKILKTEYSLDGGKTWNIYSKAIGISQLNDATIQYKSTDRAGNIEVIKEQMILIDKNTLKPSLLNPNEIKF